MKKMILTAVMLAAAALCRAQQPAETGERREWLTSFTAVEVSAPLDVKFVQVPDTEAPKIVYDTKGSYTTKFRAEVKDKVLRITERSDARRPDRTSVTVYYNSLERVAIADAVATFDSTLVATVLDLTVGGMAQVTARMDVKDLKMELTGKSTATLTGAVRYLSLFVSTGKLEAAGLEVMAAEANVTTVLVSTEDVASSSMSIGAFWSIALAIVRSCFCPADIATLSESTVSKPSGSV